MAVFVDDWEYDVRREGISAIVGGDGIAIAPDPLDEHVDDCANTRQQGKRLVDRHQHHVVEDGLVAPGFFLLEEPVLEALYNA